MQYTIQEVDDRDIRDLIDILNHYINNGFAAYTDRTVDKEFFVGLMEFCRGYPFYVIRTGEKVVGFGLLRPFHMYEVFKHTAEITYFIDADHVGKGLGKRLLDRMALDSKKIGVESLIASISSRNPVSLQFHRKHGFKECGRFELVGRKFGKNFDLIYMQKFIEPE